MQWIDHCKPLQRSVPADGLLNSMILLFIGKKNWEDQSLSFNSGEWGSSLITLTVEKQQQSLGPWLICDLFGPFCSILLSLAFFVQLRNLFIKVWITI